jgi:hypothetical protein
MILLLRTARGGALYPYLLPVAGIGSRGELPRDVDGLLVRG